MHTKVAAVTCFVKTWFCQRCFYWRWKYIANKDKCIVLFTCPCWWIFFL